MKKSLEHSQLKIPRHIAIIMDGNGRWAKKRGLPRTQGHRKGVDAVQRTVEASIEIGVEVLTLFGFSTENFLKAKQRNFIKTMSK
jgi:undecaprenyl diphosphate synthase